MLILASASPRRQALLRQIGASFRVMATEVEELTGSALSPVDLVSLNARRKALAALPRAEGVPVLAADTVVALGGEIFGKPRDEAEAAEMLSRLSGRRHAVYTGVAIAAGGGIEVAAAKTIVEFAPLTAEAIRRYVATGEPLDKAGAYAVQGRAAVFIARIEGSFSNVVGLPLHLTATLAERAGIDLYDHDGA